MSRSRIRKIVLVLIALPVILLVLLYFFLLAEERYSAWQASKMLDRLEAIRLGDSTSIFQRAVQSCNIEQKGEEYICVLDSGVLRFEPVWELMSKLPLEQSYQLSLMLQRVGLRYWKVVASSSIHNGRIQSVSALVMVVGRCEMLGAKWRIAQQNAPDDLQPDPGPDQRGTFFHWFHITSLPPGEGYAIDATANSTEKELRARHLNRSCLTSFRGCDGFSEILPEMLPVFKDRGMTLRCCACDLPSRERVSFSHE